MVVYIERAKTAFSRNIYILLQGQQFSSNIGVPPTRVLAPGCPRECDDIREGAISEMVRLAY